MRRLSVRLRLNLWYTGTLVVTVLVLLLLAHVVARTTLTRLVDLQLERSIDVLANVIREDPKELSDPHELAEIDEFGVIRLFRVTVDDRPLRETEGWRRLQLSRAVTDTQVGAAHSSWGVDDRVYYLQAEDIDIDGRPLQIAVAIDGTSTRDALGGLRTALLIALPCALVLAVIGGHLLAGRALSPLGDMASQAQEITAEQLSERLPIDNVDDELGRLATAFNATLARLENSFDRLRQFTADASHELRTPLTALRSVGEVGLQESTDPAQLRDVIGSMLEEADRLTQLVDSLLTLTRADSGRMLAQPVAVDLGEMVAMVSQDLEVLAEEKDQTLKVRVAEPVEVIVDPSIFRLALINIIDNAIKYTPATGSINVDIDRHHDLAIVAVTDDGPGIPAADCDRVFDRFYRVDGGRSNTPGGVGLGLAIARWATEMNGGRLELKSDEGGGSEFRITMPVAGRRQ